MKILYATDGSADARAAGQFLSMLPLPDGTAIRVVSVTCPVIEPDRGSWALLEEVSAELRAWTKQSLAEARAALERRGLDITSEVHTGDPAHQILRAAEGFGAELTVLGSRGLSGLEGFFLGSVARNVSRHASTPVLVGRAPRHGLRTAIVAVDGSPHASLAIDFAGRLPLPPETQLIAATVIRPYDPRPSLFDGDPDVFHRAVTDTRLEFHRAASELAEAASARLAEHGRQATASVREGDPAAEIMALAEKHDADLIIAGARGKSLIRGLTMGSVADRLIRAAGCSVAVVP